MASDEGVRYQQEKSIDLLYKEIEMSVSQAKAEVFWMAFRGLPKKEKQSIIERLLKDKEFMEDLIDIATLRQRREEPSRPLEEYLAERIKEELF
jgi:hypothetical protein